MIGYKRIEMYSFDPVKDVRAMQAFEQTHPDWKKRETAIMVTYTKSEEIYTHTDGVPLKGGQL